MPGRALSASALPTGRLGSWFSLVTMRAQAANPCPGGSRCVSAPARTRFYCGIDLHARRGKGNAAASPFLRCLPIHRHAQMPFPESHCFSFGFDIVAMAFDVLPSEPGEAENG